MNVSSLQSRPKGWPGLAAETRIPRRLQRCNVVAASRPRTHSPGFLPRVSSIGDAIKTAMKRDNVSRVLARTSPGVKFASCSLLGVAPFVSLPMLSSGDGGNSYNGSGGEGGGGDGGDGGGGGEFGRGPQEVAVVADAGEDGDVSSGEENEENEDGDESDASGGSSDSDGSSEGEEEEEGDGNVADGFFCSDIKAQGLPVGEGIPTEEDLFASLNCQAGFTCSRSELSQDIKQLYNTGLFESVNAKVLPEKKGKFSVVFDFVEKRYPEIKSFAVEGARVLPKSIVEETNKKLEGYKGQAFTMETMAAIKNVIEGWYQARGFGLSYISHFTGMPTGNVVAHVNEGRTAKVGVVYVDEDGNPTQKKGSIPASFILKHCPVEVGTLYSMNDGRKTLQNVFALDLFDNVQVFPKQNEKDPSRVEVDVMVREKPLQTADVEMEWAVAPNDNNRPSLVSIVPGGTITYEHRNLGGRAGTLAASVNTKSFLAPSEDMAYRMVYTQPFIYGLDDPKKTKISGTVFNSRKLCGVFTPGPSGDEVPVVWVDRAGAKVAITEQYSRNSSGSFGLVAQEISTLDENGALCPRGMRSNTYGQYIADGPPTTLSGTGKDRMVYAQGSLTRDTTYMVNGQQIGSRDIVTVRAFVFCGRRSHVGTPRGASRGIATRALAARADEDQTLMRSSDMRTTSNPKTLLMRQQREADRLPDYCLARFPTLLHPMSSQAQTISIRDCRSTRDWASAPRRPSSTACTWQPRDTSSSESPKREAPPLPSRLLSRPTSATPSATCPSTMRSSSGAPTLSAGTISASWRRLEGFWRRPWSSAFPSLGSRCTAFMKWATTCGPLARSAATPPSTTGASDGARRWAEGSRSAPSEPRWSRTRIRGSGT